MKRIAAVLAVLSVFSFAACGSEKKEESSSAVVTQSVTEDAAQTEEPETDVSQVQTDITDDNSESADIPDNGKQGGSAVYSEGSVVIIMQNGEEAPELSQEEMDDMTSLALKEYEAIRNDDVDGYFACINLGGFFTGERLDKLLEGDERDWVSDLVVNEYSEFALEAAWSSDEDEVPEEAEIDNIKDYLMFLSEKATPESFKKRMEEDDEAFSYQYTREDLALLKEEGYDGSISDSVVYLMLDPCIARIGDDMYASFEISVCDVNGDIDYDLDDIVYWSSGSESGLYIDECFHLESEFKGMTVDEIIETFHTGTSDTETEQSARAFYNAAAAYLEESGIDIDSALARGDFEKSFSADGLDLSGTSDAPGDMALLALLEYYEYKGNVFVGSEDHTLFVQYKDGSGEIGQVPAPQNTGAKIEWGRYIK